LWAEVLLGNTFTTEYNEEQTLRVIRKQDRVPGEGRRSKTVNDIPNAAALAHTRKEQY
jgi:hypothetical protein